MSLDTVRPAPGYLEHLPVEYQDLVKHGQYGKKKKVSDMGKFKELIEEHPMCAGCVMTLFIRLVFLALPKPEHTIFVGTAGCAGWLYLRGMCLLFMETMGIPTRWLLD